MASRRARRAGLIVGGVAAGVGLAVAAQRAFVKRDRRRHDTASGERFGDIPGGRDVPVASFDGTLLAVREFGQGPPLVLVHGFSLDHSIWHYQVQDLARDYRVVVYDHRGHGRSGLAPDGDLSLEALARDLDFVLRATTGDGPAVVVGHSMGGMALLEFARLRPEAIGPRVAGLVLANTTSADVMGGMLPGAARRVEAALQALQEAAMRALAGKLERFDGLRQGWHGSQLGYVAVRFMGFGPNPSPSQVEFVERLLASTSSHVWLNLTPHLLTLDVDAVLPAIDVPTLVVAGTHDRLTPPGAAQRMADAIPGADLAVLRGAGHLSMLERPFGFTQHLRAFLEGIRSVPWNRPRAPA